MLDASLNPFRHRQAWISLLVFYQAEHQLLSSMAKVFG